MLKFTKDYLEHHDLYLSSDMHFGHANIIRYSKRPYQYITDMDEGLIENWNSKIKPGDTAFILGDFSFYKDEDLIFSILNRLNGNIILVKGNHDHQHTINAFKKSQHIKGIYDLLDIKVYDPDAHGCYQHLVLCHYPMLLWNKSHFGSWNCYGHSHGSLKDYSGAARMDVGVDTNNMMPYSYEEIKQILSNKKIPVLDHHVKDGR